MGERNEANVCLLLAVCLLRGNDTTSIIMVVIRMNLQIQFVGPIVFAKIATHDAYTKLSYLAK